MIEKVNIVGESTTVRSVERAADLIEILMSTTRPVSLAELSERANLHPSTAHRLLATLDRRMFVHQDPATKQYSLGPKLMYTAQGFRSLDYLRNLAIPILQGISDDLGESASFSIRSGNNAMLLAQASSGRLVEVSIKPGVLAPLHCTAVGKSILSRLAREELLKVVEEAGLPANTPNTITDLETLINELKKTRNQGYAVDNEEWVQGIRCVAVPVFSADKMVQGAFSVSAPAGRITKEMEVHLAKVLKDSSHKLTAKLAGDMEDGHHPS